MTNAEIQIDEVHRRFALSRQMLEFGAFAQQLGDSISRMNDASQLNSLGAGGHVRLMIGHSLTDQFRQVPVFQNYRRHLRMRDAHRVEFRLGNVGLAMRFVQF